MTADTLPPLFGIGGKLRHGKDAVADRLVEVHGFVKVNMSSAIDTFLRGINPLVPVRRFGSWADRIPVLRSMTRNVSYVDLVDQVGFTDAKANPEVRRLLQQLGAAAREHVAPDFWVSKAAEQIAAHRAAGRGVVLSGVRFPNECDIITSVGGTLLWVHRPGVVADGAAAADVTENGVSEDDFDATIVNDGTLSDLARKTDDLVEPVSISPAVFA